MIRKRSIISLLAVSVLLSVVALGMQVANGITLMPKEQLGKSIFFDQNLSFNKNQSCSACHGPEAGWTGPQSDTNVGGAVYEGSISGRFGNRKPPSAAYATLSPVLHTDEDGLFVGGNFWDGRATGEKLGNPSADQAQGPFLNPAEQALPDSACVVYRVCTGSYPVSFEDVWGAGACAITWPDDIDTVCHTEGGTVSLSTEDRATSDTAYNNIALSIAAFEASPEVNAFTSKFDIGKLKGQEQRGLKLFNGKAGCNGCHISDGNAPLFTDFTYDNLGIPKNPENPVYGYDPSFIDYGLGGFLTITPLPPYTPDYSAFADENRGRQKVPTLRNLDLRPYDGFVKAYGHNGYFKSLKGIVHFYNTRDVLSQCPNGYTEAQALAADCWPPPEVAGTVNREELGNLGLTSAEEDDIVAFLKTLSDGYVPDLIGTWTSFTNTCKETKKGIKCKVKGKLNIENIGTQDAKSSFVRYYLSDDGTYDEGDMLLKQVATGKITTNKSKTKTFSYSFKNDTDTAGKYIIAIIDADNTVEESDETNNNIVYGPLQ
jgi:cytochrome c peroxidase